jgi:hypothetical protein
MPMIHISVPAPEGREANAWTDQLIRRGADIGINRQCAIGYHEECSDPPGESCHCHCHPWETEEAT